MEKTKKISLGVAPVGLLIGGIWGLVITIGSITFKLGYANIIGGKSFAKPLPFNRKEIHFISIETISKR